MVIVDMSNLCPVCQKRAPFPDVCAGETEGAWECRCCRECRAACRQERLKMMESSSPDLWWIDLAPGTDLTSTVFVSRRNPGANNPFAEDLGRRLADDVDESPWLEADRIRGDYED